MLKDYSLALLQKALNQTLSLDESMSEKIQSLHGRLLQVVITPLRVHFFMRFENAEIELLTETDDKPDTVIESSPIGLIRLSLLPASKARSLFNDSIRISGDMELGQDVKALFDELDIDWEGHLAHFTGDVVAYQLGSWFRQGRAITQQFTSSMRQNVTDYVQEEIRLFPPREEIEDFFSDVDELSLRSERLLARLSELLKA